MLKKILVASAGLLLSLNLSAAEYRYGFSNIYLDYQSWDHSFNEIDNAKDRNIAVAGIEGGLGFDFGEFYGFYEYENFNKSDRGHSLKASGHIYLGESDFSVYGQVYDTGNSGFSEQSRVLGFGYTGLVGDNYWFKPFIGAHDLETSDGFDGNNASGFNGYMAGWSAGYNFNLASQKFSIVNWNEIEFARNDTYADQQGGSSSWNGAVVATWHISESFYTGVQYRYFQNKLGNKGYGDLLIYRVGYSF
jgi:hypothetical protein